jgi:hypothetical protein
MRGYYQIVNGKTDLTPPRTLAQERGQILECHHLGHRSKRMYNVRKARLGAEGFRYSVTKMEEAANIVPRGRANLVFGLNVQLKYPALPEGIGFEMLFKKRKPIKKQCRGA